MRKLALVSIATLLLSGCSSTQIKYEGKKRTFDEVEDIIEQRLQDENLRKFDVDISYDKKKKRKRR